MEILVEMRIAVEAQPDIGVTGLANLAADELVVRSGGLGRSGTHQRAEEESGSGDSSPEHTTT